MHCQFNGLRAEILTSALQWEDGYILPPTEPGLGVELNEAVAARTSLRGGDLSRDGRRTSLRVVSWGEMSPYAAAGVKPNVCP